MIVEIDIFIDIFIDVFCQTVVDICVSQCQTLNECYDFMCLTDLHSTAQTIISSQQLKPLIKHANITWNPS